MREYHKLFKVIDTKRENRTANGFTYVVTTETYHGEIEVMKKYVIGSELKITKERYIDIYFRLKYGPSYTRTDIYQTDFNFITDLNKDTTRNAKFIKIYNIKLKNDLDYLINKDEKWKKIAEANARSRIDFKEVWQLRYPTWWWMLDARYWYVKYILASEIDSTIFFTFSPHPTCLQVQLNAQLLIAYFRNMFEFSSSKFLYNLIYGTGDYRYILAAIQGSILTISESLKIGVNETKTQIKNRIEKSKSDTEFAYEILFSAILGALTGGVGAIVGAAKALGKAAVKIGAEELLKRVGAGALAGAIGGAFTGWIVGWLIAPNITDPEFKHLRDYTYSPTYLFNLIDYLLQPDLTLLNYEVHMWWQLRD
jgi:hypothetical protein